MITRLFSRSTLHEHSEPAQRVLGVAQLPSDSQDLARLLAVDPAPTVRIAAARRCTDLAALVLAWKSETDAELRSAFAASLARVLAETADGIGARELLEQEHCTDAIRSEVARRTRDAERRDFAIACMVDEDRLVELALLAEHSETRMAAAGRVQSPEGLRKLADVAKSKDRGVAKLARQKIDAIKERLRQDLEADAILAQLEALAVEPGPILTAVVNLHRRWQSLDMTGDAARLARFDAARQTIQERFDREQGEQLGRVQFERRLREWMAALGPAAPATTETLAGLRAELAALREEAQIRNDPAALSSLEGAEQRISSWEQERNALAGVESLVLEAEQLAAGTSIDHAGLPARWQALDRGIRTADLTRRFEAALIMIEQRRLAQVRATEQDAIASRQHLLAVMQSAEQALAAGQLHAARAAAEEIKTLKPAAGQLPKPIARRLSQLVLQLVELERWESFGQRNARLQLCERGESLATQAMDPFQLALEVQKLRNEWKALDQQHVGVPKALWERFDGACERAYAPAAKHFAEQAVRRKEARKRREDFIAAAAAHSPTLLQGTPDWRAIERWLRDIDQAWREGDLGSVDPGTWKKLDARLKTALAPLLEGLSAARMQAKAARQGLVAEATALASRAMERDVPSQVRALQARWQEQAKTLALARRDERELWEQFRGACDAIFNARQASRTEKEGRQREARGALEEICAGIEQLALATGNEDHDVRRALQDLQQRWRQQAGGSDPGSRELESRFKKARTRVEAMLSARAKMREASVWQALAEKERLCGELDALVHSGAAEAGPAPLLAAAQERWAALPALSAAWEQKMLARRDAAMHVLADGAGRAEYLARIEQGTGSRRDGLLELELSLDLASPAEFQAQRRALQLRQLKERFDRGAKPGTATPAERLLAWCAQPGLADAQDRERSERIFSKFAQMGVKI